MSWFLKNSILLEDTHKVDDLFGMESHREDIWKKIEWLPNKSIMALVWPYGSGKSTMMHNVEKIYTKSAKWVHFDAWKYPERRDMWEWFILDFADQIWKWRKVVADEIDGNSITVSEGILTTLSVIPWLWGVEKLNKIFESKWAKRIFDLQEILKKIIINFEMDVILVIEDIDRSGEYGMLFLETLNQFLKHYLWEKNIKVITLISKDSYNQNLESYLKCVDTFEFFTPNYNNFEKFVNTYFNSFEWPNVSDPMGTLAKEQIISFLFELSKVMSIRLIKNILRKADLVHKRQSDDNLISNFRIVIGIEASKYYKLPWAEFTEFEKFLKQGSITIESIIGKFIKMIYLGVGNFEKFKRYDSAPLSREQILIWKPGISHSTDAQIIEEFYFEY